MEEKVDVSAVTGVNKTKNRKEIKRIVKVGSVLEAGDFAWISLGVWIWLQKLLN